MKAYLILVGSELLNGAMVDTNSIYMATNLNELGIEVVGKICVHDKIEEITDALDFAKNKADLVILSGGLGPTIDDLTKDAISIFLKKDLVIDELHKKEMEKKFAEIGITVLEKNLKEVSVIRDSIVFYNEPGIAPAFYCDGIAAFPGVPVELKNMFPKFLDYIKKEFVLNEKLIIRDFAVWGIPESTLEEKIIEHFIDDKVFLEFLVKDFGTIVRLVAKEENTNLVEKLCDIIRVELSENILYEDSRSSEVHLIEELKKQKLKISFAESCTGGLIASTIVAISGASDVLVESLVTYANESKIDRLGVSKDTLEKFGAVSEETVLEMLKGLKTEVGIAVSGIAGPNGGTIEKPVGTVYVGIKIMDKSLVTKYIINGDREKVRLRSCYLAINNLLKLLMKRGYKE